MIGESKFNGSSGTAARSRMGGKKIVEFGPCHSDCGIHIMYLICLVFDIVTVLSFVWRCYCA